MLCHAVIDWINVSIQIHELTNNGGVDVIVEMAAHTNLGKVLPYLAPQGVW